MIHRAIDTQATRRKASYADYEILFDETMSLVNNSFQAAYKSLCALK